SFTTDAAYYGSSDSDTYTINKETATVGSTGDLFFSTGSPSLTTANALLKALVVQDADGTLGDLTKAKVIFNVYKSTNLAMTSPDYACTPSGTGLVNASGEASCTLASLPLDTYTVIVEFASNMYFTGLDSDPAVFTVYAPVTDKFVTGGGWIVDPSYQDRPV